ncbi:MAG: hypothetical protein R3F25_06440 [Gammaproteobacteria bacterium]|jgi:hypothetical protein
MKDNIWLEDGETIVGSWSVSTDGIKSYGKIYVTNKYFRYNQQGSLEQVQQGFRKHLIHVDNQKFLAVPYNEIEKAEIVKQLVIFKNLKLTLKSGESLTFRFGVMSPQNAVDAIHSHI